jgi:uncharacterized membrane protein (UPF0136 family)
MNKLKSRKFWIAVASMLASIGAGIVGMANDNSKLALVGTICTIVSGAIYSFCEAYVDGVRAGYTEVSETEEEE